MLGSATEEERDGMSRLISFRSPITDMHIRHGGRFLSSARATEDPTKTLHASVWEKSAHRNKAPCY